jgi:hypothetical protein
VVLLEGLPPIARMGSDSFFNGDTESSWKILQVHLLCLCRSLSLSLPLSVSLCLCLSLSLSVSLSLSLSLSLPLSQPLFISCRRDCCFLLSIDLICISSLAHQDMCTQRWIQPSQSYCGQISSPLSDRLSVSASFDLTCRLVDIIHLSSHGERYVAALAPCCAS